MKPISIFRWDWEQLTVAVILGLVFVEAAIIVTPMLGIEYVTSWTKGVDRSKLELLPPTLIGIIAVYAKWVGQDWAAKLGTIAALVIAPAVALGELQIKDATTFLLAIVCMAIASMVLIRYVRPLNLSGWANIILIASGICLAIALNVPDSIQSQDTQAKLRMIFLWLTGILWLSAVVVYAILNVGYVAVFVIWFFVSISLLVAPWLLMSHAGLVESHPNIAKAVIAVICFMLPLLLTAGLVLKDGTIERIRTFWENLCRK